MAKISVETFLELIQKSRLIGAETLQTKVVELRKRAIRWQLVDADFVADALVEAGLLTRWQCDKLLSGRYKGFFLGKYKLLRHLGSGSMSAVYLAEHVVLDFQVVIKVLPNYPSTDKAYAEARAVANLNHPNIARLFDMDTAENNLLFIVMEYAMGGDLQSIVRQQGSLEFSLAARYISQAARGLHHAHEAGRIHGAVKPGNLMLDATGTVKVVDFGLATSDVLREASLTETRESVLGTADYLAPEQALASRRVDHRSDIYSRGCTFYFLLTGHPPFATGTLAQRLLAHQTQDSPRILADRPDAPPELVAICDKMMKKSLSERYQKAAAVAEALDRWLNGGAGQLAMA